MPRQELLNATIINLEKLIEDIMVDELTVEGDTPENVFQRMERGDVLATLMKARDEFKDLWSKYT